MIATIILVALIAIASLAAVIYGVNSLVTLIAGELRLAHTSSDAQVRELVAQHSQVLNDAVTKALQSVSEQLGPRVLVTVDEAPEGVVEQSPPWMNWDEYNPFPDPTDRTDPDPDDFNRPGTMSVPVGYDPLSAGFPHPGDNSAESF